MRKAARELLGPRRLKPRAVCAAFRKSLPRLQPPDRSGVRRWSAACAQGRVWRVAARHRARRGKAHGRGGLETTDETRDEQAMAEREERAGRALEAYRERRRRRRGDDTYFGSA